MMKNKSTLAKLLAEEDIFVVHKQMETAYFDSKKRELGLPIWKDEEMTPDIYDLMVGHEIGHALWTPLDMLEMAAHRGINHSFVNIIEDARIEKKGKNKYPGLVSVFKRGYVDLIKKDFFGTAGKNIASFNLIDRINIFFKSGDVTIPFSDEENVWVKRVDACKTPDDVLDLAEELYKWMEENESETDNHDNGENGESVDSGEEGEGSASGENSEGKENGNDDNKSGSNKSDAGDDAEDGKSSGKGKVGDDSEADDLEEEDTGKADAKDGNESDEDGNESDDGSNPVGGKNTTGNSGSPEVTTDSAFGKALDKIRDKHAKDRVYASIPKLNLDKIIINNKILLEEYKTYYLNSAETDGDTYWNTTREKLVNLKNESKKTVAYMVKEFEMKKAADQYARAATSKTGTLDMSKLHTYKYNEDLFKKVTTLPGATNHGMIMVLDWSGSMYDNLENTLIQMYNLIWFCRRTKIPFEVFAFSDRSRVSGDASLQKDVGNVFKAGNLAINSFHLLNFFSSTMTINEELDMMHILLMYASRNYSGNYYNVVGYPYYPPSTLMLGGTPLNDAIIAMMDLVPKFKNDTGVQKVNTIFLTDGASNHLPGVFDYKFDKEKNEHEETVDPLNRYTYWRNDEKVIIITDPVMNKTYEIKNMTNDLLRILKNRVMDMNVVGFFIAGSGRTGKVKPNTLRYLLPDNDRDMLSDKIKFINKNKYLVIKQLGYDEYYILPGGKALATENETLDDELVGASKAKLKTAFGKISKGKISSRQLLNKFVAMVA